jgi:N-acetylmuramoyl-L-alanine amidase
MSGRAVHISDQDLEDVARLVYAEDTGYNHNNDVLAWTALAHVIRTRTDKGWRGEHTAGEIIRQNMQFEPMRTASGKERMRTIPPEKLAQIKGIVAGVFAGKIADPTGGADHFLSVSVQENDRGGVPSWFADLSKKTYTAAFGANTFTGGDASRVGQVSLSLQSAERKPTPAALSEALQAMSSLAKGLRQPSETVSDAERRLKAASATNDERDTDSALIDSLLDPSLEVSPAITGHSFTMDDVVNLGSTTKDSPEDPAKTAAKPPSSSPTHVAYAAHEQLKKAALELGVTDEALAARGVDIDKLQAERGVVDPNTLSVLARERGLDNGTYVMHPDGTLRAPSKAFIGEQSEKALTLIKEVDASKPITGDTAIDMHQQLADLRKAAGLDDDALAKKGVDVAALNDERGVVDMPLHAAEAGLKDGTLTEHNGRVVDPAKTQFGPESKKALNVVGVALEEMAKDDPERYAEAGNAYIADTKQRGGRVPSGRTPEQMEQERRDAMAAVASGMGSEDQMALLIMALLVAGLGGNSDQVQEIMRAFNGESPSGHPTGSPQYSHASYGPDRGGGGGYDPQYRDGGRTPPLSGKRPRDPLADIDLSRLGKFTYDLGKPAFVSLNADGEPVAGNNITAAGDPMSVNKAILIAAIADLQESGALPADFLDKMNEMRIFAPENLVNEEVRLVEGTIQRSSNTAARALAIEAAVAAGLEGETPYQAMVDHMNVVAKKYGAEATTLYSASGLNSGDTILREQQYPGKIKGINVTTVLDVATVMYEANRRHPEVFQKYLNIGERHTGRKLETEYGTTLGKTGSGRGGVHYNDGAYRSWVGILGDSGATYVVMEASREEFSKAVSDAAKISADAVRLQEKGIDVSAVREQQRAAQEAAQTRKPQNLSGNGLPPHLAKLAAFNGAPLDYSTKLKGHGKFIPLEDIPYIPIPEAVIKDVKAHGEKWGYATVALDWGDTPGGAQARGAHVYFNAMTGEQKVFPMTSGGGDFRNDPNGELDRNAAMTGMVTIDFDPREGINHVAAINNPGVLTHHNPKYDFFIHFNSALEDPAAKAYAGIDPNVKRTELGAHNGNGTSWGCPEVPEAYKKQFISVYAAGTGVGHYRRMYQLDPVYVAKDIASQYAPAQVVAAQAEQARLNALSSTGADPLTANIPQRSPHAQGGSAVMAGLVRANGEARDSDIAKEITEKGNIPDYMKVLAPVTVFGKGKNGNQVSITYHVMPDYLSVGTDGDSVRVPMGLPAAQRIANKFGMMLPTRTMVDQIYAASDQQLGLPRMTPGPQMSSTDYLLRHNNGTGDPKEMYIAGLNITQGRLASGHKKDIVLTNRKAGKGRVAIYGGGYKTDGDILQPLSTVHGANYADYSHGVRLVAEMVELKAADGTVIQASFADLLTDPNYAHLVSNEGVISAKVLSEYGLKTSGISIEDQLAHARMVAEQKQQDATRLALSESTSLKPVIVIDSGHRDNGFDRVISAGGKSLGRGHFGGTDGEYAANVEPAVALGKSFEAKGFEVVYTMHGKDGKNHRNPNTKFDARHAVVHQLLAEGRDVAGYFAVHHDGSKDRSRHGTAVAMHPGNLPSALTAGIAVADSVAVYAAAQGIPVVSYDKSAPTTAVKSTDASAHADWGDHLTWHRTSYIQPESAGKYIYGQTAGATDSARTASGRFWDVTKPIPNSVPAMLLEVGFLTNDRGGARAEDPKARAAYAEAVAKGFTNYYIASRDRGHELLIGGAAGDAVTLPSFDLSGTLYSNDSNKGADTLTGGLGDDSIARFHKARELARDLAFWGMIVEETKRNAPNNRAADNAAALSAASGLVGSGVKGPAAANDNPNKKPSEPEAVKGVLAEAGVKEAPEGKTASLSSEAESAALAAVKKHGTSGLYV